MPINANSIYIGKGVLGSTAGAPLSADANGLLSSGISNTEVSATTDTTTTSTSDVLISGMTITPVAGTYLVLFSTTVDHSNQSVASTISIYSGGTLKTDSVRSVITRTNAIGANSNTSMSATNGVVTVNGSQAIEIKWKTTAGTATAHARTLNIIRVA